MDTFSLYFYQFPDDVMQQLVELHIMLGGRRILWSDAVASVQLTGFIVAHIGADRAKEFGRGGLDITGMP